jgi:predicted CxxxxCH...CXXCH cytochrome family protein
LTGHADGDIDVTGGYPANVAKHAVGTYAANATCSTTTCHGVGGASPVWGATNLTGVDTCVKCHGVALSTIAQHTADPNRAAPGYTATTAPLGPGVDNAGQTGTVTSNVSNDPQVGAHDTHLRSMGGYKTGGVQCSDCHAVTAIGDAGHMNGSVTMTWSALSRGNVPDPNPAWQPKNLNPTYTAPTCSTNYCHGGGFAAAVQGTGLTQSWVDGAYLASAGSAMNAADCNKCHQSPPTGAANFAHSGITLAAGSCSACHNHDGFGDARHIDGILQAGGGACNACHGYGPSLADGKAERAIEGKGAHEKHVNHLVALRALTVAGFALNPDTDQFGAGDSWTYVCGVCHNGATHNMGEAVGGTGRTIAIPASYQFGANAPVYNGVVGVSSATTAKSCSSVSCHFSDTPVWSAY